MRGPIGRPRTAEEVEEAIFDLTIRGFTPTEIHRAFQKNAATDPSAKVPSLRTVQRNARKAQPDDDSDTWRIEDSPPDDARVVLDLLALGMKERRQVVTVTTLEAEWIARLRVLGPVLSFTQTLRLARLYIDRRNKGTSTEHLDAFLALAPWRSISGRATYLMLLENGTFGHIEANVKEVMLFFSLKVLRNMDRGPEKRDLDDEETLGFLDLSDLMAPVRRRVLGEDEFKKLGGAWRLYYLNLLSELAREEEGDDDPTW